MALFSDLLKEGWSTSRPGDMKNGGHAPQMGGFRLSAAEQRAKEAMEQKQAEQRIDLQEKQRAFFASLPSHKDAERKELVESIKRHPNSTFMPSPEMIRDAQIRNAAALQAIEAAEKPNPDRPQTAVDAW